LSSSGLLILNGAILTVCAVFDYKWRTSLLIAFMLFLPLLDKQWVFPDLKPNGNRLAIWLVLAATGLILLASKPNYINAAINTLFFAAFPEEWFFRGYFMQQLARQKFSWRLSDQGTNNMRCSAGTANIISSVLFALLHIPTQGWAGLAVFFPSLFYGWIYQKSGDIVLLIFLHALSNIVFFIYINPQ